MNYRVWRQWRQPWRAADQAQDQSNHLRTLIGGGKGPSEEEEVARWWWVWAWQYRQGRGTHTHTPAAATGSLSCRSGTRRPAQHLQSSQYLHPHITEPLPAQPQRSATLPHQALTSLSRPCNLWFPAHVSLSLWRWAKVLWVRGNGRRLRNRRTGG